MSGRIGSRKAWSAQCSIGTPQFSLRPASDTADMSSFKWHQGRIQDFSKLVVRLRELDKVAFSPEDPSGLPGLVLLWTILTEMKAFLVTPAARKE